MTDVLLQDAELERAVAVLREALRGQQRTASPAPLVSQRWAAGSRA